ncbi:MAG TPA: AI-2E family transporter [Acidobacteriaceae bacterium]|nr:AI-2E family transporter [Acidobacteriaceae bacterium]
MKRSSTSRELAHLLTVVLAVVTITVLYVAKAVIVPLALAVLFTFLLAPLVTLLERIRLPRVLAIVLVICAAGGLLGTIAWTMFRQLIQVTDHLPAYTSNIDDKMDTLHREKETSFTRAQIEVERLGRKINLLQADATTGRSHPPTKALGASPNRPVAVQEVGKKDGRLDTLNGVLGAMVSVLLVIVFTFFMLLERESLRNRLIRLTGRGHLNLMTQAMDEASHRVSRYLLLQALVNTCYASIIFVSLHFIQLPHALLWGALAGLLRFVPYIGAPIAALLPTVLSLAVFHGWTQTLLIMTLFFCMEVVTANFVEPHLYGKHTGLSSLAILVAAVFWSLVWGPIGLILSVPLTVCLVVVGSHVPNLEFLTVLLGDQPVIRPEAHYYQRLLANDEREASQVLETYRKDHSLLDTYDCLLIPALSLSEQDRHRNALDDATVAFISETTKELVDELGLTVDQPVDKVTGTVLAPVEPALPNDPLTTDSNASGAQVEEEVLPAEPFVAQKVACVPVRDDADEVIAMMLAQLLERAGHSAAAIPLGSTDGMLAEVYKADLDFVCLSALPPYGMSHARRLYRKLRAQNPDLKIVIGLWNYIGDCGKAASEISGGEQKQVCTTLAQVIAQVNPSASEDLPEKGDKAVDPTLNATPIELQTV